jgi:uncharacterized membrane protein
MNTPHVHLLLNHVPTVGMVIAIGVLMLSFVRKDTGLRRISLELFYIVGLLTLPAYLSGMGTAAILEPQEGISKAAIERHHDAAVYGFLGMVATGAFAWLCLWQIRRLGRAGGGSLAAVTLMSLLTLGMMGRTATIGGEIRHPEIMTSPVAAAAEDAAAPVSEEPADAADAAAAGSGEAAVIGRWVTAYTWIWPACEALHFIGLWLLFGVVAIVNLRMLGLMKSAPFAAFHRLLPWAVLGLGVNLITGMLFVLGAPSQYLENIAFFWKMGLLMLAALDLLYLTVFDTPWAVEAGSEAPATEKMLAAAALASWVGVMYFGRMLPFIGNAF